MNPITLPTSPETRAALEKMGLKLHHGPHSHAVHERWEKPNCEVHLNAGDEPTIRHDDGDEISLSEVARVVAILHMTPVEQRKAEAYTALRDAIMDAASDLDAAFVLLENDNPTDAKRHLSAAIGRLMLGGKREAVAVPMDLARRYRKAWYDLDQRRVRVEREEVERALAVLFRSAVVSSEHNTPMHDEAPPPPHPSEDGGLSPSPLAAIDDRTAAMMSEVLDREPGLHRVRLTTQPREEDTP